MESSERHNTLVHFRFNPEYKAQRGRHGEGSNRTGREGEDILLKVPVGTIVYDAETGEKVYDFSAPDERVIIARGGRGGRGNARFATSTHQAPHEHEDGRPGEERRFRLELKLLADVGAGRISERRQIHPDLTHLGGPAQDRRLSVHHSAAESGSRAGRERDETKAALLSPIFLG